MPAAFESDVFLSHSAKDKALVRPLAERLRRDRLSVWFDECEIKPGDSMPAETEKGLHRSFRHGLRFLSNLSHRARSRSVVGVAANANS